MKNTLLLLVIISIIFSACTNGGNNSVEMILGEESSRNLSDIQKEQIITLSLDKKEYNRDEVIQITIINNSAFELEFGGDTEIEKLIDQKWVRLNFTNMGIDSILYRLESGEEFTKGLFAVQFLEKGNYRLIKGVSSDGESINYEVYLISESFNVIKG